MRLYQSQWMGIKFKDINNLSLTKIANHNFYKNFYIALQKKYTKLHLLPKNWLTHKMRIYKNLEMIISQKLKKNKIKILSFSCGTGYIENLLSKKHTITTTDVNKINKKFLNNKICFSTNRISFFYKKKFDLVLVSGIDYCLTDKEYLNFLNNIEKINCNLIILTEIKIIHKAKVFINFLKLLLKCGTNMQFWGYIRSQKEHLKIFKRSKLSFLSLSEIKNTGSSYVAIFKKNS